MGRLKPVVFTQLDLMEKRGSGFQKITMHTSSFFTTVYSVLYGKKDADFQHIIDEESTPKLENTTQKPVSETAQKILDLLTDDPYLTRQALAPILDLTPDGVKYHLNKLQRDGYLERKEGRKTGRWIVLIKK